MHLFLTARSQHKCCPTHSISKAMEKPNLCSCFLQRNVHCVERGSYSGIYPTPGDVATIKEEEVGQALCGRGSGSSCSSPQSVGSTFQLLSYRPGAPTALEVIWDLGVPGREEELSTVSLVSARTAFLQCSLWKSQQLMPFQFTSAYF